MARISMSQPEVAARTLPGHCEAWLIKGASRQSLLCTLVEWLCQCVRLVKLDGATADGIFDGFTRRLRCALDLLSITMVYNQGARQKQAPSAQRLVQFRSFYPPNLPVEHFDQLISVCHENSTGIVLLCIGGRLLF